MIKIGTELLKGLDLFSKKEKKQDKTQILIQILDKIEKDNPEKEEQLQDLKIDIMENIPLTNEKKIYLKKEIDLFKKSTENPKQEIKKQEIKIIQNDPEFENTINACATSLNALKHVINKIEDTVNSLYNEIGETNSESEILQIRDKNDMFRGNLRRIISTLNITHAEILNQIGKAKSVQTKMAILDNGLDLKNNCQ